MKLSILPRFSDSSIFNYEAEENNFKITLKAAIKAGADLRNANLYGEKLTKPPVQLNNLKWSVLISDKYLRIGCRRFTIEEWKNFDDPTIDSMSAGALKFWRKWKTPTIELCDAHTTTEETKEGNDARKPT